MNLLQAARQTEQPARDSREQEAPTRVRIVNSADLLEGRRELWIEHGDDMYRLRLTASGKLYLTK